MICDVPVVNVDLLTYAANPRTLLSLEGDTRYAFERADIGDRAAVIDDHGVVGTESIR